MTEMWATILGSGVVAALASAVVHWLLRYFEERRVRAYGSLRAVVVLERYALMCADIVQERLMDSEGIGIHALRQLPEFPTMPGDIDWKLLDKGQSERALTLPLEIEIANGVLIEIESHGATIDHLCAQYMRNAARIGWRSWVLAGEMRATARLPKADTSRMLWDFTRLLSKYASDKEARQQRSPVATPG